MHDNVADCPDMCFVIGRSTDDNVVLQQCIFEYLKALQRICNYTKGQTALWYHSGPGHGISRVSF